MCRSSTDDLAQRLERIPRVGLAHLPTPLEPLPRLTAHLGGPRLWVKREDCSGLGFGGNKLRKLDYVLSQALAQGADTLVSGGVAQSNSQRQVAAAAAKLGLACHLVVYEGRVTPPSPDYHRSGNALLNRLFGAEIETLTWTGDRNTAIESRAEALRAQGRKPFVVPYGVSNARGALAYASTVVEIARQSAEAGFTPSAIVHCSGSGGTQAGLVLGARAALPETRVLGIDIDAEPDRVEADVLRYAEAAAELLQIPFEADDVEVLAGHAGPAYGVPQAATLEAIELAARLEALVLDPVYSGKGLAGLIALVRDGRWKANEEVVFLHSGGEPALFAYREALGL
ncbi:MAG: D-cysteine desulfhydrase family protein [Kiloniellales bacterium]|nr:D-cysteine desulfhydrase family protein [Kiloniellales bacterium]